ncbi:hypothetical protein IEQ34_006756 [Dendrobium chrysotoxum]|uniref:non-specific serine/threonine protein kinase n=1 Tax=Dendrobium chrysotoxum TaxID=161865 RepID=A0AAV7H934_DENCH|nr:hypothetical protein IEQ34_006756 [Dendrobium chrysotoxum]
MSEKKNSLIIGDKLSYPLFFFLLFLSIAAAVTGDSSPQTEKQVLVDLKHFLLGENLVNRGHYAAWNESESSPCLWPGIACTAEGRVFAINLSHSSIAGGIFPNFSLLPALTHLDLSDNAIDGRVPQDLNQCRQLLYLNLSQNLIAGDINLTALTLIETLDVSVNRLAGRVWSSFPASCGNLVVLNISSNDFTGEIAEYFDGCRRKLKFLDLSLNQFDGEISRGFWWLSELSASDNRLTGAIRPENFPAKCSLVSLDLSGNGLNGSFPDSIANCSNLKVLNLWGNFFTGRIPSGIGSLTELNSLFLGNNSFDQELPVELLNCSKLTYLDLSRNNFRGEMQRIFGNFSSLKFLILHTNSYTDGIEESGILKLPNLRRLDLSYNNFSRELPITAAEMIELEFLMLASNDFYGKILPEYGRIKTLQVLDLSFNRLSGEIPPQIGNLTTLLWLMLRNNELTGGIPPEIGNCSSLMWLNLANNRLSGRIPPEIAGIGRDPSSAFKKNQLYDDIILGSNECHAMVRWLPATYPPFSFVYSVLNRRTCSALWDLLLKGHGIFSVCLNVSKPIRTLDSSGYLQLSGNLLSGVFPSEIGRMQLLSILSIANNKISGELPPAIGLLPLVMLNASSNNFSGPIPPELGRLRCLQFLDLSLNNFSGDFPSSLNGLSDLNKFNVSFNPLLHGIIPITGQITTFGNSSFIGDPLISFSTSASPPRPTLIGGSLATPHRSTAKMVSFWAFISFTALIFFLGLIFFIICLRRRSAVDPVSMISVSESDSSILEEESFKQSSSSTEQLATPPPKSTSNPSSSPISVFHLDITAFTYTDIVAATRNFSPDMVIGRGGSGVVYRGTLPDGRQAAVKKLQRGGTEGERDFRAEMEVLSGGHPNLVALYGWCLAGPEKLLVYEYMEGGSLEEVIEDKESFGWINRLEAVVGVARAMVYLHHECSPSVVHRDVKASNVMRDADGNAKVTDFGLARVVVSGETHVSTVVAGTVGYVAPEYGQTWRATRKGDVYSFGVLTLELATGRRAVEEGREESLVEWSRRMGKEEVELEGWGEEEGGQAMRALLRVGIRCTEEAPQDRPDMREVLELLLRIRSGAYSMPEEL